MNPAKVLGSIAQMAELVDALGSGPSGGNTVEVRVLFWAPDIMDRHALRARGDEENSQARGDEENSQARGDGESSQARGDEKICRTRGDVYGVIARAEGPWQSIS